jgi:hypothetical protein
MAAWDNTINSKFYGQDATPEENRQQVKYKSGRVIYYKLNSAQKTTHAVLLRLNDSKKDGNGKTEFERFLEWNETTNGSGTVPIELTDIIKKTGTKNYYVHLGNWSGQRYKEIALTLEEC